MKQKDLTPEQRERRRIQQQTYYRKNRERILAQQKEYYIRKGRAWNAERARKYRQENHNSYCAKRREYRKRYSAAKRARRATEKNRQSLCSAPDSAGCGVPLSYYQRNKVSVCKKTIGEYCYRAIEKVQRECPEQAEALMLKYPFDGFTSRRLRRQLWYFHIHPSQARYDDCYDAGMMAYLYSIHRCACTGYSGVERYIAKMIRIFLICAVIVFPDARNLCKENNLRELNLDQLPHTPV